MTTSWHNYPSIFNLGHRMLRDLFTVPINVEEKVDGSQFSFGLFMREDGTTQLRVKSKSVEMSPDAPQSMFKAAVDYVKSIQDQLRPGWTYRGEVLAKPKHNVLAYDRTPKNNIIIFDINSGDEHYLSYEEKAAEAARIGLEVVPLLARFEPNDGIVYDQLRKIIDNTVSVLSGQKIEGVVIKPALGNLFNYEKKLLIGKFVSEQFKEVASAAWGRGGEYAKPQRNDVIAAIGARYGTQARWQKAVQHLREAGKIEDAPQDIGLLIREIPDDVFKEAADDIKEMLFRFFVKDIRGVLTKGMPEWYKDQLLHRQFSTADKEEVPVEVDGASR